MKRSKRLFFWIGGIIGVVFFLVLVLLVVTSPPKVRMIYYTSMGKKIVEKQVLQASMLKRYGKDSAIARQYFEGPLSYVPEVWFLDAKVRGVWVITPKKPTHLVIDLSQDFFSDLQRHPLLVQRWIEGLFHTLRENKRPIEKCSFLVEGRYQSVFVGRWNLFYPVPLRK
ncbi:MAG: hypothetical protein N2314_00410 [Brevinematales bacterium]|nr:hypothetical protein [Brevinematales bacterium]